MSDEPILSEEEQKIEQLRQRLANAKAKRVEAADAREKAKEPERLLAEIELEEKRLANDEVFAELQAKHGESDVQRIDTEDGGMLVVERPKSVAFKRFQQSKTNVDDCDSLVRTCLVHPSKDAYNGIVSKYPAKIVEAANKASELAGVRRKEAEGK